MEQFFIALTQIGIFVIISAIIEKIFHLQGNRKKVYRASLIFGNIGFIGIPLVIALPGIEMVPMLAKTNGSDGDYAVCAIMITTIACLITLPIVSLCISLVG